MSDVDSDHFAFAGDGDVEGAGGGARDLAGGTWGVGDAHGHGGFVIEVDGEHAELPSALQRSGGGPIEKEPIAREAAGKVSGFSGSARGAMVRDSAEPSTVASSSKPKTPPLSLEARLLQMCSSAMTRLA